MESNTAVVFLGLIALALVVQTALLIGMAVSARKVVARLTVLERSVEEDVRPALASVKRIAGNAEVVSRHLVDELPVFEAALHDAVANVRRVTHLIETVETFVLRPLGPLVKGLAVVQGVRRGLTSLRRPEGLLPSGRS